MSLVMMTNAGSVHVDVISNETIKPSSPTPHTHKTFKLSFLDQLLPTFYVPVIFFYPKSNDQDLITNTILTQNLKPSFSEALSLYYPLAGRLDPENPIVVDCNDAGAQFVQARAHAAMDDVIQDPKTDQLLKYLPLDPSTLVASGPLLAVQVSFFDCGGIAVGVCSSHQLTDAVSLVAFVGSWAQTCRQGQNGKLTPLEPDFALARHFPPRDLSGSGFQQSSTHNAKKERLVAKRFVFDAERLGALRRAATSASGSTVKDPTRVELVTAFIWRNIIELGSGEKRNRVSAAWHIVNLRPRIKSRSMENVFGNCIIKKFVLSDDDDDESHDLVGRLRNGLKEVDEEFIWKLAGKDDDEECDYLKDVSKCNGEVVSGEMEACGFSSWTRMPVYEMDFGMGNPVWVCPMTIPEKNSCYLMGTKDGVGIELWVSMLESTLQHVDTKFQHLLEKSLV